MTRRTRRAMTLREFQATGRLVDNIGAHPLTGTTIVGGVGRVYAGGAYIQRGVRPRRAGADVRYEEIDSDRFWVLHIGSEEHAAGHDDLARLERMLFEWAQREGLVRTEDQPVPELRPMPSRIATLRASADALERARTERERIIAGNASTTPNRGAREAMHARENAFTDTYATDTETQAPTTDRSREDVFAGPLHDFRVSNWGRDNVPPPPPPVGWRDEVATLPQWVNNMPQRSGELNAAMERVRDQMMSEMVQDNRIPGGYPPQQYPRPSDLVQQYPRPAGIHESLTYEAAYNALARCNQVGTQYWEWSERTLAAPTLMRPGDPLPEYMLNPNVPAPSAVVRHRVSVGMLREWVHGPQTATQMWSRTRLPPRETTSINVRTLAEAMGAIQRAMGAPGGRAPDYIVAGPQFANELMRSQGRTPDSGPVGNLRFMGIPVRITSWEMEL